MELARKRITGLARQSCTGLNRVYGCNVDYTSFASQLDEAFKTRDRFKEESKDGSEVPPQVASAMTLIDAVMKFGESLCARAPRSQVQRA